MKNKAFGVSSVFAVAACKLARRGLRVLKKGGTALPGRIAAKIDSDILAKTSSGVKIIVVTGTNGKTTTANMISHALSAGGIKCLANRSGANLLSGVTAEFCCSSSLLGRPKYRYAVIECDEGALKQVVPRIKPEVIVVTNLFRDQLDRYGEVMHTLEAIREGVKKVPQAVLCLNSDCSLTSSLALSVKNPVMYYGMDQAVADSKEPEISDARYCLRCGTAYEYNFRTYAHLGDFYCPKCGYKRQKPFVAAKDIKAFSADGTDISLRIGDEIRKLKIGLPAIYNVYNALAAICGYIAFAKRLNTGDKAVLKEDGIYDSLASVKSSFGRMEQFDIKGVHLQMILVKNPAGCNQAISYLTHLDKDYELVLCLNDRTADGHDISWIWDADYELFEADSHLKKIYLCGDRAEDLLLRMKYAGVDTKKLLRLPDYQSLLAALKGKQLPVFAMPNYTSMLALREVVAKESGKSSFWEG